MQTTGKHDNREVFTFRELIDYMEDTQAEHGLKVVRKGKEFAVTASLNYGKGIKLIRHATIYPNPNNTHAESDDLPPEHGFFITPDSLVDALYAGNRLYYTADDQGINLYGVRLIGDDYEDGDGVTIPSKRFLTYDVWHKRLDQQFKEQYDNWQADALALAVDISRKPATE